jgi:hypothetical protein
MQGYSNLFVPVTEEQALEIEKKHGKPGVFCPPN